MDRLWAPWRMAGIREGFAEGECFLCEAAEATDHKAHYVVARSAGCFCLLNLYPYNNGHLLVAPYRHEADLEALDEAERADLLTLTVQAKKALDTVCAPHGFNIGMNLGQAAGAGLAAHVHLHIVPRWSGDTNFMTTLGSAKIIPQALDEMWKRLTEAWERTA